MKSHYTRIALILFFFGIKSFSANAQDTLYLKSGEVYITKLSFVGDDAVMYKLLNNPDGPSFEIKKSKISYIALSTGTVLNFSSKTIEYNKIRTEQTLSVSTKKNALKWEVFSLLTNDLCFGYERYISNNQSIELKVATIGIGNDQVEEYYDASGFFVKLGYKFIDSKTSSAKTMVGPYIKPEISYSEFKIYDQKFSSKYLAVNYGLQSLLMGQVVIEIYGGVGIAYNEAPAITISGPYYFSYNFDRDYFYSNTSLSNSKGYASCFTGGLVLSVHF